MKEDFKKPVKFSRRDFIAGSGAILLASLLGGCTNETITSTVNTTKTSTLLNTITSALTTTETLTQTSTLTDTATETLTVTETATVTASPVTRTIVDDLGRTVEIPIDVKKALCCGPVDCLLIYMLAPQKLGGWTMSPSGNCYDQTYSELPYIGGWYGKQTGNFETFIALNPDIVFFNDADCTTISIDNAQENFGSIPVVNLNTWDTYDTVPDSIEFMGIIIGAEENAQKLINYYNEAASYVSSVLSNIPEEERVTVYYAEGDGGLYTDPAGSQHTELIDFCGGINIADVEDAAGYGMTGVSMEQVLLWDPDIIIVGRGSGLPVYNSIITNEIWAGVNAVVNDKVYLRPSNPFSWFDGPCGMNEIVGIYWMIKTLYPEQTADLDLKAKVQEFYSDFYHYDLTDTEYAELTAHALTTN
jgi:iron complex transport system substrate-binding protein